MKIFSIFFTVLYFCRVFSNEFIPENKNQVIIGSHLCVNPEILKEFLDSLERLENVNYEASYFFIDDKLPEKSKEFLVAFQKRHPDKTSLISSKSILEQGRDDMPYDWPAIDRAARLKNQLITHCIKTKSDYLLIIDCNVILQPKSLDHLVAQKKELLGNIVWITDENNLMSMPQAWVCDDHVMHDLKLQKTYEQTQTMTESFKAILRKTGLYEVGGIGACILLSKKILENGLNYNLIKNLSFWKIETHFSLRATALNIPLYVDTNYPAYHLNDLNSQLLKKNKIIP